MYASAKRKLLERLKFLEIVQIKKKIFTKDSLEYHLSNIHL